jgi:prepilin-type processing-associated H-X9-DG protein
MANELLTENGLNLLAENGLILEKEYYEPFWTNTNNTLTQEDNANLLFQDGSVILLQSYKSTDWEIQSNG